MTQFFVILKPLFLTTRSHRVLLRLPRRTSERSFLRAGESKKKSAAAERKSRSLLEHANDWKLQVDFEERKLVFPPTICASSLRPDVVIWSTMTRFVTLLELTCCAEEGIEGAQLRKETKYASLVEEISGNNWTPRLLEVGARGLIGSRTFRIFVMLGMSTREANRLCKL